MLWLVEMESALPEDWLEADVLKELSLGDDFVTSAINVDRWIIQMVVNANSCAEAVIRSLAISAATGLPSSPLNAINVIGVECATARVTGVDH